MSPKEFWDMTPVEFWWLYDNELDRQGKGPPSEKELSDLKRLKEQYPDG